MIIKKYEPEDKIIWDDLISRSKNGTFLFYRDYMEYHSDRFEDHSLMVFKKNSLICVFPANIEGETIYSHGGLTFGGFVMSYKVDTVFLLNIFKEALTYYKNIGISKLIYKVIPYIYHITPASEDLYALFLHNSKLIRRDISSAIDLREKVKFSEGRKYNISKGKENNLYIGKSDNFIEFMELERKLLKDKYDTNPIHTNSEMEMLAKRFPENIKLFTAKRGADLVAGTIIYESQNVAHAQYIASTEEGKRLYAQDILLDFLIKDYYKNKRYFDFGISSENNGKYLNEGLIKYKERFGASGVVYDFYEIDLH